MDYQKKIIKTLKQKKGLSEGQLIKAIGIKKKQIPLFRRALYALAGRGELRLNSKGCYVLEKAQYAQGKVAANARGFGFLLREDEGEDVAD